MNTLKLGDFVHSTVSHFTGILTAICHYLHGEDKSEVTCPHPVDGEVKREWFVLSELEITE